MYVLFLLRSTFHSIPSCPATFIPPSTSILPHPSPILTSPHPLQANSTYPKFSPGYLSLHKQQRGGGMELKWIPIDLLNCNQEDPEAEPAIRCTPPHAWLQAALMIVCILCLPSLSLSTLHS